MISQKEIEMVRKYFEPIFFKKYVIEEAGKVPDYLLYCFRISETVLYGSEWK
jgi:hypothetical protein